MYLLDTNVISELRKPKANTNVVKWARKIPTSELYLSSITILEIEMGVLSKERKDESQGTALRYWLENVVIPNFHNRTLNVDIKVARTCAQLHVPNRKSERDALIAATALTHNLPVVTRNTKDFKGMNLMLINPWDDSNTPPSIYRIPPTRPHG